MGHGTTKGVGVRRALTLIAAGLVAAVAVAGCTSQYHYVKSSSDHTYFKVPSAWKLYNEKDILDGIGSNLTDAQRQQELDANWRVAFDASPKPSLLHLGADGAKSPSGIAIVRTLDFDSADSLSLSALRNYFFD